MIFNTGAALLDAVVLSVVSREVIEHMVTKLHMMFKKLLV